MCVCCYVQLFATPWTIAHQAPLCDFPGKNRRVRLTFPFPEDFPDPRIRTGVSYFFWIARQILYHYAT